MKEIALKVIKQQRDALDILCKNLPASFDSVCELILNSKGKVILSGIGKSGIIARKIASSFSSTGTSSYFLHPGEASHGDLGIISDDDILMILSNSGETSELADLLHYCKSKMIPVISITMNPKSTLGKMSRYILTIPKIKEISSVDAPSISSLLMLSIGDSLMISLHEKRGFSSDDFKKLHPGGQLGFLMQPISDIMHTDIPSVGQFTKMSEGIIVMSQKGFGALYVVEGEKLCGVITDGDIRRNMHHDFLNKTASEIMNQKPKIATSSMRPQDALAFMNANSITSLPVVDEGKILGIVHLHDLLRLK